MLIPLFVGAKSCACQAGEEVKDKANVRSILKSGGGIRAKWNAVDCAEAQV